ncbi:LamB/YcsF family protein [Martelella alba]|uniref:5-oxoprolinase subunit A n=1 Tax=Martelella alba TaxID=2590451 RepID=A0ABY2SSU4_9HYPH|nr:5-oxoprolinase subunit PxpA [Martelella alba]TKI08598.1 LamB/YcsF family protein [Martelella alba]
MQEVDLNSDLGESFGQFVVGNDDAMLDVVTSANVACGFHAGDALVMHRTVENAKARGLDVGAHPGFMDLWGFGRRAITGTPPGDIGKTVIYQLGAMQAVARACGHIMTHVKLHGAMATQAFTDPALSEAIVNAIRAVDRDLILVTTPHNATEYAARQAGLRVACEVFADRSYGENGLTLPRHLPDAVIHDPERAAERAMQMIEEQAVRTISGVKVPMPVHTLCVHGDNPQGVAIARRLRERLTDAGIALRPLSQLRHL